MAIHVVSGDEILAGFEVDALVDQLLGGADRQLAVEEHIATDPEFALSAVVDTLVTPPMFGDRRIVVVRAIHELAADATAELADALGSVEESAELVLVHSGRLPKVLADALRKVGATAIGASVGTSRGDRTNWVEAKFVEAGLGCTPATVSAVVAWLGGDHGRLPGLLSVLVSSHGEGARIEIDQVRPFLDEGGSVEPWLLTDAIDEGRVSDALAMLHRMMRAGEMHALQVMALLSNRYMQMMKLDGPSVSSNAEAAEILGVKPYPAGKMLDVHRRIGGSGVAQALEWLASADVDLRGGKDWPDELVMEVLVARLARLGAVSRRR
jgi:DNA polymerase-3 subunit delta